LYVQEELYIRGNARIAGVAAFEGYVVAEPDVPPQRDDGDTAWTRVTIDASAGSERLEQRVHRFGAGRSRPRFARGFQEVLYATSGSGVLYVDGNAHAFEAGTGAFVADGESWEVENPGPDELVVVAVRAPAANGVARDRRKVTVRYADQPALPAGADREFRYLVNQDAGCLDMTQFVGVIPPGRAPDHSHTYDEVVYVVDGEGSLHVGDRATPIAEGSCIHLPPLVMHCLENTGAEAMRVLGVFHPSGDPASRAAEATTGAEGTSKGE
jgi:mannose-6-phosphate isomerase-like protein (cupin superfamily)